ncbi:DUF4214 domain-containing protein [Mesorhizobium sp. CAU 1741]|uniref:DUF4214 domain-containing protein n=1 Tax=Mesorhizobium sp. CAU 1741 TaxID=3140366 RepID=UPI00325B8FBF
MGLEFFNTQTGGGEDLTAIGNLAGTAEYQARFEGLSNTEVINSIYLSLFGRPAEGDGADFWAGELEAGRVTINDIAIAILDGAQNDDLVIVQNKLVASDLFTTRLDLPAEVDDYVGSFAAEVGRDFLDGITTDASTIPNAEVTDLQIAFLDRDASEVMVVGSTSDADMF